MVSMGINIGKGWVIRCWIGVGDCSRCVGGLGVDLEGT